MLIGSQALLEVYAGGKHRAADITATVTAVNVVTGEAGNADKGDPAGGSIAGCLGRARARAERLSRATVDNGSDAELLVCSQALLKLHAGR